MQIPPNYPKLGAQNAASASISVPAGLSEPERFIPLHTSKESHFEIRMARLKKPTSLSAVRLMTKEWMIPLLEETLTLLSLVEEDLLLSTYLRQFHG